MRTGRGRVRRAVGVILAVGSFAAGVLWLGWRALTVGSHPLALALLATEVVGLVAAGAIAAGLASRDGREPTDPCLPDVGSEHRFGCAIAALGGVPELELPAGGDAVDGGARAAIRAARPRSGDRPVDAAVVAVLVDGPRVLALVAVTTACLVVGVAPMPVPPAWALAAVVVAAVGHSTSHVLLGGGRVRVGDRIRWSYATLGEVVPGRGDPALAPRRWVGVVAAVVVVNLAMALRGTSDRWTHGLAPMTDAGRAVTMVIAIVLVLGGLFSLDTSSAPVASAQLGRLDERSARQSALGAAVAVGVVGLLAGTLPGCVDPDEREPAPVEEISEHAVDVDRRDVPVVAR